MCLDFNSDSSARAIMSPNLAASIDANAEGDFGGR